MLKEIPKFEFLILIIYFIKQMILISVVKKEKQILCKYANCHDSLIPFFYFNSKKIIVIFHASKRQLTISSLIPSEDENYVENLSRIN